MSRTYNFSAGPAMLPKSVLQQAAEEMLDYQGSGQSVMEMSHRSTHYEAILTAAELLVRDVIEVPKNYHVLFLQGGARLQFHMVPLNFMTIHRRADFTLTGFWAQKAIEAASQLGKVNIVGSSQHTAWSSLPPIEHADPDADYFHLCYNNTIEGTQYHTLPNVGTVPLIADVSSGILSKPLDIAQFAVLYACAQKNLGQAGVTLVLIREDMVERIPDGLPAMLDYRTHIAAQSMYNTPPCYAIYILKLVLEWIKQTGRDQVFRQNSEKAKILYDFLDQSSLFYNCVEKPVRSLMNIPFMPRESNPAKAKLISEQFAIHAASAGFVNLAGHHSVGGMRASIYNAMPLEGVKALVQWMEALEVSRSHSLSHSLGH